jgi:hypothetical protein
MDKSWESFGYLRQKFPIISEIKMKEGPQITKLFEDQEFSRKLNST